MMLLASKARLIQQRLLVKSNTSLPPLIVPTRFYFTNADRVKKEDPYAALGLTWGATVTEIKLAYKAAARELHPDVSDLDPETARKKFQRIQEAYDRLLDVRNNIHRDDKDQEFSFQVWRRGDVVAQERTDVAGVARKRPVKPAGVEKMTHFGLALGQPDGSGVRNRRAEFLGDGVTRSGTVGTGRNKWTTPHEFKPWNPDESKMVRARKKENSVLESKR